MKPTSVDSGERSSWLTFATNSSRIRSLCRMAVMSRSRSSAPARPSGAGRTCTSKVRPTGIKSLHLVLLRRTAPQHGVDGGEHLRVAQAVREIPSRQVGPQNLPRGRVRAHDGPPSVEEYDRVGQGVEDICRGRGHATLGYSRSVTASCRTRSDERFPCPGAFARPAPPTPWWRPASLRRPLPALRCCVRGGTRSMPPSPHARCCA